MRENVMRPLHPVKDPTRFLDLPDQVCAIHGVYGTHFNDGRKHFKDATAATANNFRVFLKEYYTRVDASGAPTLGSDRDVILAALPFLRDWYIQAGAAALNASDTFNRGAANDDQYAIQQTRSAA